MTPRELAEAKQFTKLVDLLDENEIWAINSNEQETSDIECNYLEIILELKNDMKKLETKYQNLKEENQKFKDENLSVHCSNAILQQKNNYLQEENLNLQEENQSLQEELDNLKKEKEDWKSHIECHTPSFANSNYKRIYSETIAPKSHFEIITAVHSLLKKYRKHQTNLTITKSDIKEFMSKLNQEIRKHKLEEQSDPAQFCTILWTSSTKLHNREFCSILNYAIRSDTTSLLKPAIALCRAINQLLVTRKIIQPTNKMSYRGGGISGAFRHFYEETKKYRAPMFLATSGNKKIAVGFIQRSLTSNPEYEPILWYFKFDQSCKHVKYLSHCGEEEFLFTAYSVFTVEKCIWKQTPTSANPHEVYLKVAPDNQAESEELPSAPWC